ncbi:MAG TPA: hypothetical protein VGK02_01520 [Candidatus Aquicultor sp.]|jgi:hypothetical protein
MTGVDDRTAYYDDTKQETTIQTERKPAEGHEAERRNLRKRFPAPT